MSHLIIQIPAYNEAETIGCDARGLAAPSAGFHESRVAAGRRRHRATAPSRSRAPRGIDHVVSLSHNRGLAFAFMAGLEACLKLGADVIVNTDADNQYDAACIAELVQPILEGRARIVVGERPIATDRGVLGDQADAAEPRQRGRAHRERD